MASTTHDRALPIGDQMRIAFGMPHAPVLEARDLRFGPLVVTELRYDADNYGKSEPIPAQDALLVSVQLQPNLQHEIWEDGRHLPNVPVARGMTSIFDLRRSVTAHSMKPFHSLNFSLPLRSLEELGDDRLDRADLSLTRRLGLRDPVIHALGTALIPALANPEAAPRLFVDHVLLAMRAHIVQHFGSVVPRPQRGGLTRWQERRALSYIDARLAENISLANVARECSLSVAQFARAFKRSTGLAPYQFLTERRVDRARELLSRTSMPLAEVAMRCGFADQSHFTKVFRRAMGASPGSFRTAARTSLKPR